MEHTSHTGEDGDFVQLRAVREKKRINQINSPRSKVIVAAPTTKDGLKKTHHTANEKLLTELRDKLFSAVDEDDAQKVTTVIQDIKQLDKTKEIHKLRRPETDENVLHYALSEGKRQIAKQLIANHDDELKTSYHEVKRSDIQGKNNALHIITEQNDTEMAKYLLQNVYHKSSRTDLLTLETAVEIQGQRPRNLSCLHLAAYYGYTDLVRLYLDHGISVNHINSKKDTPLLWAARWGHNDTVTLLLEKGAKSELENDKGSTPLYWAVRYEHAKTVALLLQKGRANPNKTRKLGLVAPLVVASAFGNTDIVSLLLQNKTIDVNMKIRGGETAIHHAAKEGHLDVVKQLVNCRALFDNPDECGDTPLLLAAQHDHVEIVHELLKLNANLDHRNNEGHDVWYFAVKNEDNALLELLVAYKDHTKTTRQPLCIAGSNGKCDKIRFLLDSGMDPHLCDADGNTFLHHAALENQSEIINRFNEAISVKVQNNSKNTPLHIACLKGFSETISSLLKCKAPINVRNLLGETPLHIAAASKYMTAETARELVQYTIKTHAWETLNEQDFHGKNSLHIAGKYATPDVLWEFRFVRLKDRDKNGFTPLHEAVRPDDADALNKMLDIFEAMKRDARINEQSFEAKETVLHLAADVGHFKCVERLLELGSDISLQDCYGDTAMHRLTRKCSSDLANISTHLQVFDTILENIVKWWCTYSNVSFPDDKMAANYRRYRREATIYLVNSISNNEGLSVLDLAFKVGCPEIISRLLMMPDVFMFEQENCKGYKFDISGLTPRTNSSDDSGCCGTRRVSDSNTGKVYVNGERMPINRLSGLEWLISQTDKSRAAEILDLPPVQTIERYYMSMVARMFAIIMFLHITYMSIFTWVGVDVLTSLREDSSRLNFSDPATIMLYSFVPLEPVAILIYVVYTIIRTCACGDISRRSRLSRKRGFAMVRSVISSYVYMFVLVAFAALVLTWIGLFTMRFAYQDFILSLTICLGWLLTISFTRGIKLIHYFYKMLLSMLMRDVLRFIIVYLFVMLAFGFAFHVLFLASSDMMSAYATPGDTLFMTFNLMIGMAELFDDTLVANYNAAGRESTLIYLKVFYVAYIVLGTIVLLNLLIAMMNDSYSTILKQNQVTWRIESVTMGIEIESSFRACHRISNVSIFNNYIGSERNSRTNGSIGKRWFVNVTESAFREYKHEQDKKHLANHETLITQRFDDLENRTAHVETLLIQTLAEIKDILNNDNGSETKKKVKIR